ncbi:MAG: hypothetical protein JW936_05795, partial [Sedimentisphaerales bacterium]|nr:hypothetical protein [Sedimentisphaerales bacterium]
RPETSLRDHQHPPYNNASLLSPATALIVMLIVMREDRRNDPAVSYDGRRIHPQATFPLANRIQLFFTFYNRPGVECQHLAPVF